MCCDPGSRTTRDWCPALERQKLLSCAKGVPTGELLKNTTPPPHRTMFGFLNHDYQLFQIENAPKAGRWRDRETKSRTAAPKPAPVWTTKKALTSFRTFLRGNPADAEVVVEAYNRTYRGYIEPTYTDWKTPSRWGSRVSLRPHPGIGGCATLVAPGRTACLRRRSRQDVHRNCHRGQAPRRGQSPTSGDHRSEQPAVSSGSRGFRLRCRTTACW